MQHLRAGVWAFLAYWFCAVFNYAIARILQYKVGSTLQSGGLHIGKRGFTSREYQLKRRKLFIQLVFAKGIFVKIFFFFHFYSLTLKNYRTHPI